MKILLIFPPRKGFVSADVLDINAPLGLLHLASYTLDKNPDDYEFVILDTILEYLKGRPSYAGNNMDWIGLSVDDCLQRIEKINPDVIGISMIFSGFTEAGMELCQAIKKRFVDKFLIIGGLAVSINSETSLRQSRADIIVRGEGEITFHYLLETLRKNGDISKVDGIAYLDKYKYIETTDRPMIQDLDSVPLPAYHLADMKSYFKFNQGIYMRSPSAGVFSSRGCNYPCIFCSIKDGWGKWRKFSPKYVVDHIQYLIDNYSVREIDFFDDQLLQKKKHFSAILDEMLERKVDIKWVVSQGMSVWLMDETLIRKMYRSGFYRARFTIESGNEKSLKFIKKPVDLEKARKNVDLCWRLGIWTDSNFMIGLPFETNEDIQETHEYAKSLKIDWVHYVISQPYEGTEMAEIYRSAGLLDTDKCTGSGSSVLKTQYGSKYFKAEELNELRSRFNRELLALRILRAIYPWNWYREFIKINSLEKIVYCFVLLKKVVKNYL